MPVPSASPARSRPVAAGLAAALVLAGATAVGAASSGGDPAAAEPTPTATEPGTGVDVAGEGTVSGTPDVLRFTVGVEARAASVDAAVSSASASATKVIAALGARRVAKRDTQTATLQIFPQHDRTGRVITGYVVRQDLRVSVRDLRTAGATITAAVAAGGNAARLSGVSFALEDDEALRASARDEAYVSARAKAEQYARLSGRQLGAVVSIDEDVRQASDDPSLRDFATAARAAVPIEAGSTDVRVTVRVRWALR